METLDEGGDFFALVLGGAAAEAVADMTSGLLVLVFEPLSTSY